MEKRLYSCDALRLAAFLAVSAQHVLGAYARNPAASANELRAVAVLFEPLRFAVPLFVFLFGLMLFYGRGRFPGFLPYIIKRSRQLLIPYILWSLLYLLWPLLLGSGKPISLLLSSLPLKLLTGGAFYHLWYVVMIFQFVLLAPLFLRLYAFAEKKLVTRAARLLAAAAFAALCLLYLWRTPMLEGHGWLLDRLFFKYRSLLFPSWLLFFGLGALCGANMEKFTAFARRALPLSGGIFLCSVAYAAYLGVRAAGDGVDFSLVSFLNPLYAVFTLCGLLALFALFSYLRPGKRLLFLLRACSDASYGAYLSHALLISLFSLLISLLLPALPRPVFYGLLFLLASAGALILARALKRLRVLLTGPSR